MMPTQITPLPPAPVRSDALTNDEYVPISEAWMQAIPYWTQQVNTVGQEVEQLRDEVAATAMSGDLPPITGHSGKLLRVNDNETALAFQDNPLLFAPAKYVLASNGENYFSRADEPLNVSMWSDAATWQGITKTKTLVGVDENNVPFVEYLITGTALSASALTINNQSATRIPAAPGEVFTHSAILSVVAGTLPTNGVRLENVGENAGLTGTGDFGSSPYLDSADTSGKLFSATITAASPTTAFVRPAIVVFFSAGEVLNFKIRISGVQLDRGPARINYRFVPTSPAALGVVPAGMVGYCALIAAPVGWLKANGALVSRTTYAALFSAIGTTFGAGDGSTTFALPDLRGEFLRGWDDGRGVDSARAFGSAQGHGVVSHQHAFSATTSYDGVHQHEGVAALVANSDRGSSSSAFSIDDLGLTSPAGGHSHTVSGTTALVGGNETRPRNVALLACIKY